MQREQPVIYEINTWVWLADLARATGNPVTLSTVADSVWDSLAELHVDFVWFMGVWQRSPASIKIARQHTGLQGELAQALPDLTAEDIVGSAYAIKDYVVAEQLGGDAGLAAARRELRSRGISLLLDYVPNHVAVDHPWVTEEQGSLVTVVKGSGRCPAGTFTAGDRCVAHGRDPYFPPWTDTAQLNAFSPSLRVQASKLLQKLATMCDGVRCDMAMLLLDSVFQKTWAELVASPLEEEFWTEVIAATRAIEPNFKFMAEAYWDLEPQLLGLGFDWAYDKTFYDRLRGGDGPALRQHLGETAANQSMLVKFTENHDEPRAAAAFSNGKNRLAAVSAALMPGPLLIHEGQLEGRSTRIPVQLGRRRVEPAVRELEGFYRRLLALRSTPAFRTGSFRRLATRGWPDNKSHQRLVAWLRNSDSKRFVIIANMSDEASQAHIPLPWEDLRGGTWRLEDPVNEEEFVREGDDLLGPGLFVDLVGWGFHVFRLVPA